jgi:hypothetical protein
MRPLSAVTLLAGRTVVTDRYNFGLNSEERKAIKVANAVIITISFQYLEKI